MVEVDDGANTLEKIQPEIAGYLDAFSLSSHLHTRAQVSDADVGVTVESRSFALTGDQLLDASTI